MNNVVSKLRAIANRPKEKKAVFRYARSDIVTILAGPDKIPFKIHKDLLCDQSEYFAANFGETWNTDNKAEATVSEIEEEIFQMIFSWLYTGEVPDNVGDEQPEQSKQPIWRNQFRLYQAADFLMMTELMNKIVDKALTTHRDIPGQWTIKQLSNFLVYGVADYSQFYKLVLDSAVSRMVLKHPNGEELRNGLAAINEQYPQAMIDIILRLNEYHAAPKSITVQDWCIYHMHPNGQACERQAETHGDKKGSK